MSVRVRQPGDPSFGMHAPFRGSLYFAIISYYLELKSRKFAVKAMLPALYKHSEWQFAACGTSDLRVNR